MKKSFIKQLLEWLALIGTASGTVFVVLAILWRGGVKGYVADSLLADSRFSERMFNLEDPRDVQRVVEALKLSSDWPDEVEGREGPVGPRGEQGVPGRDAVIDLEVLAEKLVPILDKQEVVTGHAQHGSIVQAPDANNENWDIVLVPYEIGAGRKESRMQYYLASADLEGTRGWRVSCRTKTRLVNDGGSINPDGDRYPYPWLDAKVYYLLVRR